MVRSRKRKTKPQQTSPPPPAVAVAPSQDTAVPAELLPRAASTLARVRRSSVAPRVTCGLCGGILRDATTVSECLHSFCRKCIYRKIEDEDINYCPTCNTDLGCAPLAKLRSDHSLQRIRSLMFPAKKHKVEGILPRHPASISLSSPSPETDVKDHPAKKTHAYMMGEPMNTKIETEPDEKLGMEHSTTLTKPSALSLDSFSHLPATALIIQGGNEVEEEEIAPDHPVLATSEKRENNKLTLISEEIFGVLNCNANYRTSTPSTLPPMTPTRSGPPSTIKRTETTLASVPSSEIHGMEVEVVKETSSSQGWTSDLSMLRQATSVAPVPDQIDIEIQANSPFMPPASTGVASSGPIRVQTSVWCDKNWRNELLSICNENAERMWQCIDSYMSQSQVCKEVAKLKEELQNAMSEKTAAFGRSRVLENILKEQNERLQIESERSQAIEAACLEMLQEYRELARLKEFEMSEKDVELTSLKHNSSMIEKRNVDVEQRNAVLEDQIDHVNRLLESEKLNSKKLSEQLGKTVDEKDKLMAELNTYNNVLAGIKGITHAGLTETPYELNEKCEEQAERLHSESNWTQATEATLRELLREYRARKSEASNKVEELTSLKHNNNMIRERSIEAKQRNNELKTYNGGLDMIHGCIRRSLTARISRLRQASTTVKVGHYEDLLARIDALGQVKEHLPKISETIEIAASLSAYSAAASIFVSLRAYHGYNFDLQRLLLPLHLNKQEYARIRNAVDPLAAQVAQKYEVCKH